MMETSEVAINTEISQEEFDRLKVIRHQKFQVLRNIKTLECELTSTSSQLEKLGFSPDCPDPVSFRRMRGQQLFNTSGKEGLEYMFAHKILDRNPESVANFFFHHNYQLSKICIGSYIGETTKEFNMKVLDAFTKLHALKDMSFTKALREFLLSFHLPGESQKIDRILESFAHHYFDENPGFFTSKLEGHVLAYAAVMLNTTFHNVNAKSQNTGGGFSDENKFVQTMLDYDDTKLNESLIRDVYHDIKTTPILPASNHDQDWTGWNQFPHTFKGWLYKMGGRVKSWKRRFFVLTEYSLVYLHSDRAQTVKGSIPLEGINVRSANDKSRDYCFELFSTRSLFIRASKADRDGHAVPGNHSVYRMAATSSHSRDQWLAAINSVLTRLNDKRNGRSVSVDSSSIPSGSIGRRPTSNPHYGTITSNGSSSSLTRHPPPTNGGSGSLSSAASSSWFKRHSSNTSSVNNSAGSQPDLSRQSLF